MIEKKTIQNKLFFILTIFITLILFITYILIAILVSHEFSIYTSRMKREVIENIKEEILNEIKNSGMNGESIFFTLRDIRQILQKISLKYKVYLIIKSSRMMGMHSPYRKSMETHLFIGVEKRKYDFLIEINYLSRNFIIYGWFLNNENRTFIIKIQKLFLIIFFISLILIFIFSYIISVKISRPIGEINKTIKNFTEKGKFKSLKKTGIKEIDLLIEAFSEMAQELIQTNNQKEKLFSNISHELRTPVSIIKSYLEALIDGVIKPDPDILNDINEEVEKLESMIEDLSKIYKEKHSLFFKKENKNLISLNKYIEKLITKYNLLFKKYNYHIHLKIESLFFKIPKKDLDSIFENLIKNSLKYNHKDEKHLWILAKSVSLSDGEFIIIKFRDNGDGIPQKDLPYIFDRFYRVDKSRSSKTGGRGLGLSIVKETIEKYKGSISVDSMLNEYTEFTILFPLKYLK